MKKYRLTVTDMEVKKENDLSARMRGINDVYHSEIYRMLEVELTEEEWKAVKKAVVEVM